MLISPRIEADSPYQTIQGGDKSVQNGQYKTSQVEICIQGQTNKKENEPDSMQRLELNHKTQKYLADNTEYILGGVEK